MLRRNRPGASWISWISWGEHMKDVRKLVPRTPPEGLLEWAAERHKELDQDGLLIETEWAQDWSLEVMLDEWAENRKVRAIRATCSACKESGLLWRGRDGRGEWGFIHPGTWTEGEGGEVCADGDKTTCPWCGESVIVRRKADVRKKGWFVAAERHVMSASVLGKDRLLTLTGWTVQRRITAAAGRQLVAIPAEAYVFSAEDCAQLMGWVNSYSGTTGYSIQYTRSWRQPKDWVERWGSERGVFGLTPELVADSCLPHCKLDRYMAEPRRHAARYPVAWLRLCQKHPNAESLLVHGLPDVLDELIAEQTAEPDWKKNKRGELELPEIRWSETRPAQMLGLTRDELAMARSRCWGTLFWRLFTQAKDAGETLTDADIAHAFYLGDENVLDLVGRGPVGKSLRYLLRQIERAGVEPEDEDPQPEGVIDVSILLDYWRMAELTGRDLADPDVRWPEDLLEAHDRMSDAVTQFEARELASKFRIRRKQLARYAFQWRGLLIRPAASQRELVAEGDALHHCVGTYAKDHANGKTAIFFIRRAKAPRKSFYTLELNEGKLVVRQNRGRRNCARTKEVEELEAVIDTRTEIVKDKGRANVVMCTPEYYGLVLKAAGKDFTPSTNDRIAATGNVGQWLGFTFVEANGATGSIKYYDHTGAQKTVDMSKVQYVMYYHETLSVVSNFEVARIIDSERFAGSLAQVEMNTGYRVTNSKLARVRKVAGAG